MSLYCALILLCCHLFFITWYIQAFTTSENASEERQKCDSKPLT